MFRILGPLEVVMDEVPRPLGGVKQRSVLAILILHRGEVVSGERLVDELWCERPPVSALKTLQGYVSRLRKTLGAAVLQTHGHGYVLSLPPGELDLDQFERLAGEGSAALSAGDATTARERLGEALSLWRGPPLSDFAYEPFAQSEIARLEEARVACLEERIDADMSLGRRDQLVGELEQLVREHPSRERLRGQLMLALYRAGRQADALNVYWEARRILIDQLGIEPSRRLRELHEAILAQDPRLEGTTEPAPAQQIGAKTNLPTPANQLIGRQPELQSLRELLLGDARLVTVTGAGGSGKTRLVLELATSVATELACAAYFVPLAQLRDADRLPETIISALEISDATGAQPLEILKSALRERRSLLVLDNVEHLVDATPFLAELLADCPQLKVLATSRASLHLSGEHEYPLEPLHVKDAIALFVERASAVRPDFCPDVAVIAGICRRLDCLPLAVELAAARSRLLSCQELLIRLEHRLELLTGGPRDLSSRQRTLQATIEWSHELLDPDEQSLFARLAVFTGGCTLEAAERVCDASLDQLASLVDKHLLNRSETGGEGRFWMLDTVREYALERLAATTHVEEVCQPYAEYYVALAKQRVAEHDHGELAALDALERELDNIRTALAWTQQGDAVPVPVDDGACDHLRGTAFPRLVLDSSHGPLDLAALAAERLVLYVYPGTTRPGQPTLPGLHKIAGGLGCTPQSLAFRDHAAELAALGARVAGLSIQTCEDQIDFAETNQMPFPIISDPQRRLESALDLPTFEVAGVTLYRRVTVIVEEGTIVKVFYPVFPPERNADEVVRWLSGLREDSRARESDRAQ
jgi:predicted ATPase/DNA-binding SARP family transcriptional activator/peroxiredoxin